MKAVVKAILSFMLTSWTYSEIMLVVPEIEPITKKIITALTIPTHNEWRVYYDKEHQAKVSEDLNSFFERVGLDVQSDQSSDSDESKEFEQYLEIPQNLNTDSDETTQNPNTPTNRTYHVSIFENSALPKRVYESF